MCKIAKRGRDTWDFPWIWIFPRGRIYFFPLWCPPGYKNGSFAVSISVIEARSCEKLKGRKMGEKWGLVGKIVYFARLKYSRGNCKLIRVNLFVRPIFIYICKR